MLFNISLIPNDQMAKLCESKAGACQNNKLFDFLCDTARVSWSNIVV